MALFAELTSRESDALWWQIVDAHNQLMDEADRLRNCPQPTRDILYGPGAYEAALDTAGEMADLLALDNQPPVLRLGGRAPGVYWHGRPLPLDGRI